MLKKNYNVLVLIQTYNDGEYLIKAVKSMLSQTYKKLRKRGWMMIPKSSWVSLWCDAKRRFS